jgi:hypothetical protein
LAVLDSRVSSASSVGVRALATARYTARSTVSNSVRARRKVVRGLLPAAFALREYAGAAPFGR